VPQLIHLRRQERRRLLLAQRQQRIREGTDRRAAHRVSGPRPRPLQGLEHELLPVAPGGEQVLRLGLQDRVGATASRQRDQRSGRVRFGSGRQLARQEALRVRQIGVGERQHVRQLIDRQP